MIRNINTTPSPTTASTVKDCQLDPAIYDVLGIGYSSESETILLLYD
jgi:hypothetical protein